MSLAASSSLFALPRTASSSSAAPAVLKRSFGSSASRSDVYRTSTGQTAVLPVHTPTRHGGKNSDGPDFTFLDARSLQQRVYPFSKTAVVPFIPPVPAPRSMHRPPQGMSLMQHINTSLRLSQDPNSFHYLFDRKRNRDAIPMGSIVTVSSWTTAAKTHATDFTGLLMAVRRRGACTTFTIRNSILRTGVEMKYHCSSPLVRDIKVVKRADGKPGGLKKARSAKLYYLRDQPHRLEAAAATLGDKKAASRAQAGTVFK